MTRPSPTGASHNKRNYPRAPVSIRVFYRNTRTGVKEGFTAVVGGGGLFIDTVAPLPIGTAVTLDFTLPGQKDTVQVEGEVVWVRPDFDPRGYSPGMGVQFKRIQEKDREHILELVMRVLTGRPESDV